MDKSVYIRHIKNENEHWWFKARREILSYQIKKYTNKNKIKVLDFGAGSGTNIRMLSHFGKVDAYEKDLETTIFLKKRFKNTTTNIINKPFSKNQKYDLILAADVIEHIKNDKIIIKNLNKILKKDGLLIITVPAYNFLFSKKDETLKHFRRYNQVSLKRLFNKDYKKIKISYYNFFLFIPISILIIIFKIVNYQFIDDVETKPNSVANNIFYNIFRFEKYILKYVNLPFGLSIISIFKKI